MTALSGLGAEASARVTLGRAVSFGKLLTILRALTPAAGLNRLKINSIYKFSLTGSRSLTNDKFYSIKTFCPSSVVKSLECDVTITLPGN